MVNLGKTHYRTYGRGAGKPRRNPRVIRKVNFQVKARKSIAVDRKRVAMLPGVRMSKFSKEYMESRDNRSDLKYRL